MYINDQLSYDISSEDTSCSDENLEMLTLIIKPMHQRNFIVSLVYIPPTADKAVAIERIKQLSSTNNRTTIRVIAGDFNMEYSGALKRQKDYNLLQSLERSFALSQIVNKATCTTSTTSSLINFIFVSMKALENISLKAVFHYNVSDHNIVCLSYKKESIKIP